jgi:hypothetical protein
VVPVGFAPDRSLLLAMADPGDSLARSDVAVMTKLEVTPVIAAPSQIQAAVEHLPATGLAVSSPADAEPDTEGAAGALLWQADEAPGGHPEGRSRGMLAVETGDHEDEARSQRLTTELAEQRGRVMDLELELQIARAELDEQRSRHERNARELRQALGERDAQIAALNDELAYRDGRLGELERRLAKLAASRDGAA